VFQKLIHSRHFIAFNNAIHQPATIHSSIAALVEFRASSILNFFSFISISEAAHTLITATQESNLANLSEILSLLIQLSSIYKACFNSSILPPISSLFH